MIDAHQHFWTLTRDDYGWLTPDQGVLYRDHGPSDLKPLIDRAGIASTVLVQAAPTVEETRYLLDLAATTSWVGGVVGWVPLEEAAVGELVDRLSSDARFKGVRPMIQDIADDDWMLRETLGPGLRALSANDLSFDALVHPRHLSRLSMLLERHPDLRVVIDHGAKPAIADGGFDGWAEDIARLGRETSACCKLSGLVTEARPDWQVEDLRPYCDHLLACFGAERLMWGSDWPVVELAGGWAAWWEATETLLTGLSEAERKAVLGGTATKFYRLDGR